MTGMPGLGDIAIVNTEAQTYLMTTEKVAADGTATIRVVFEAIRMNASSPMANVNYDSANPGAATDPAVAEVARMYGAMLGESLTLTVASDGTVRSVTGTEKIRQKVEGTPAAASAMGLLGGNLSAFLSDETMRATFGRMLGKLPTASSKAGDVWTQEIASPNPAGNQTITNTFTRQSTERVEGRELTKIGLAQTIKTSPGGAMGPFTIEAGDATGTGEFLFDHTLGRLERSVVSSTAPMTLHMGAPDGSSISLQSVTTSKVTFELVRK